jgi:alanyl-tRNA synthetase
MTSRIYYTDAACVAFDAVVRRTLEHEGRPAVVLDRTAFYPSSGGQPFDTGQLGPAHVLDVVDADDGDVVHVLDRPLAEGLAVSGSVDFARRFDHMQQHTGQHVLSAAFDRLHHIRTVGFHLGAGQSTIDLDREATPSGIDAAVSDANRIVWEDRPVTVRFASGEEAAGLPLRKEPARHGTLRLIEIEGFDLSACGGTHVARTGAIGLIAVVGAERFRGGTRVSFVCGGRALAAFDRYRHAVVNSVRRLSVLPDELPGAIERIQSEGKELRRTIGRLQEALARHEAARLVGAAAEERGVRMVAAVLDGWDAAGLKAMASAVAAEPAAAAVFVSAASPAFVAVARSAGVAVDASRIVRELASRFGGRGGGRPELAQGGGLAGDPATILAAARELLAAVRT